MFIIFYKTLKRAHTICDKVPKIMLSLSLLRYYKRNVWLSIILCSGDKTTDEVKETWLLTKK